MNTRQDLGLWTYTAISWVIGLLFVLTGSSPGWFLILLGMIYLGSSSRMGQAWAKSHPTLARWGLIGITVVLILLFVFVNPAQLLS